MRIRDKLTVEIRSRHEDFIKAFRRINEYDYRRSLEVLIPSLEFGYLHLERDRWLRQHEPSVIRPEFPGLSFADPCAEIRSMENLGNWTVGSKRLLNRLPAPVANLVETLPLVAMTLTAGRSERLLDGYFRVKLVRWTDVINQDKE